MCLSTYSGVQACIIYFQLQHAPLAPLEHAEHRADDAGKADPEYDYANIHGLITVRLNVEMKIASNHGGKVHQVVYDKLKLIGMQHGANLSRKIAGKHAVERQ